MSSANPSTGDSTFQARVRLRKVACAAVCIIALALLAAWLAPPQAWAAFGLGDAPLYRASAWLRLSAQQPYIAYPPDDANDYESFQRNQATLITSKVVLRRALESLDLASLPKSETEADRIERLQGAVRFRQVDDSELWELSCDWPDAKEAAAIANAVVETYSEFEMDTSNDKRKRILELLDVEQSLRQRDIELKLEARRQLIRELGSAVDDAEDELIRSSLIDSYGRLQRQLDDAIVALNELEIPLPAADDESAGKSDPPAASNEQARLTRRKEALSSRQRAILEEMRSLTTNRPTRRDNTAELLAVDADIHHAKEVHRLITDRAVRVNTEARSPSRIQVIEKAEVPTAPLP